MAEQAKRSITVIIPVYRPDKRLPELVRRLAVQSLRPEKILIADTLSRDGGNFLKEACEASALTQVFHVKKEEFDHGGTRDKAAGMAAGDLLVFMTMDALPADRCLLEELAAAFDDEKAACAYARQLPAADAGVIEAYTRSFSYPKESRTTGREDLERLGVRAFFCSNVCAAYRRDLYLELGGFPKRAIFNEDMIFAGRAVLAGYHICYRAKARVIHSHNYSGRAQFHRNFDLGVSQADHPQLFELAASEREGVRLVGQTAAYLLRAGRPELIGKLVWQSGCKYLGYWLGKRYRRLPRRFILRCTMNRGYWERQGEHAIRRRGRRKDRTGKD